MAAGMLLVAEAGGKVTDRYGQDTHINTLSIVATNGKIHDLLIKLLSEAEVTGDEKANPKV